MVMSAAPPVMRRAAVGATVMVEPVTTEVVVPAWSSRVPSATLVAPV